MAADLDFEVRLMSALLAKPEGRIFCGLLISETGFLGNSAKNSVSPENVYFREGERNVGQRVFELAWRVEESMPLRCLSEYGEWLRMNNNTVMEDE